MILIFAYAFDYGNIFSKSKTNTDKDKKEIFRMEIVKKKGLVSIYGIEIYLELMFCTYVVETVILQ